MQKSLFRIVILFVAVFVVISSLSGCVKEESQNTSGISDIFSSSVSSGNSCGDSASSDDEMSPNTTSVHRELSSGVVLNADVFIPENIDYSKLPTYEGELQRLDVEQVVDLLFCGDTSVTKSEVETNESRFPDAVSTLYESGDGSTLSSIEDVFSFQSAKCPQIESYLWLEPSTEYNGDVFLTGKDLSFGSQQECFQKIRDVLKQLDITVTDEYTCYTIEHEAMSRVAQEYRNKMTQQAQEAGVLNEDGTSMTEDEVMAGFPDPNYTENDDCYYFKIFASVNGFPITWVENGIVENGGFMPGSMITAIYSKDGIVSLNCSYIYQMKSEKEAVSGLDLEEAISALDSKYNSVIPDGKYEVEDISFEYVPISEGDSISVELTPAWRFQMKHTVEVSKSDGDESRAVDLYEYVLINAVTGKEILKDVGTI